MDLRYSQPTNHKSALVTITEFLEITVIHGTRMKQAEEAVVTEMKRTFLSFFCNFKTSLFHYYRFHQFSENKILMTQLFV